MRKWTWIYYEMFSICFSFVHGTGLLARYDKGASASCEAVTYQSGSAVVLGTGHVALTYQSVLTRVLVSAVKL